MDRLGTISKEYASGIWHMLSSSISSDTLSATRYYIGRIDRIWLCRDQLHLPRFSRKCRTGNRSGIGIQCHGHSYRECSIRHPTPIWQIELTQNMIYLLTVGSFMHSTFDMLIWYLMACFCFRPGGCRHSANDVVIDERDEVR